MSDQDKPDVEPEPVTDAPEASVPDDAPADEAVAAHTEVGADDAATETDGADAHSDTGTSPDEPADADADAEGPTDHAPEPAPAKPKVPRGAALALQLALPVVLCGAAVGVHWSLNVPDEIHVSPRDQGAKKNKKKARKKKKRARKAARKATEPRDERAMARELKRWGKREFTDEPVVGAWAQAHQTLLSKAFVVAQADAFDGAPEAPALTLSENKCRTIRCRVMVRSPFPHELDAIDSALAGLQSADESMWREYTAQRVEPPAEEPEGQHYLQVTVAFASDELEAGSIVAGPVEVDTAGPPTPAAVGATGAAG